MSAASRTRLYIGKVSSRTREGDLRDIFGKYGYIRHVDVKYGFAFVEFERERDAEEAVRRLHDTELDGSRIIVEFSRGGRDRGGRDGGGRDGRRERGPTYGPPQRSDYRATVENLPRDMSWQDLKDHFRAAADVIFADTWHDRYSNRYCGAVEFRSRDDLRRAIRNVDGTEVRGCRIRVFDDSRRSRSRSGSRSRSPPSRKRRRVSRSRSRSPRSPRRPVRRSPSRSPSPSPRRRSPAPSSTSSSSRTRRSPSGSRSPPRSRSRSPSPRGRSRSPNRSRSPPRTRRDDDEPDAKRARRSPPPSD